MNLLSILAFLLCAALCYSAPPAEQKEYTTQFDDIDLDEILKSKRLVTSYVNCVVRNTGCTAAGKALKESLPDALRTNCSKCSKRQREGSVKVFSRLEKDYPDELKKVLDTFDSDRKYFEAFKKTHYPH